MSNKRKRPAQPGGLDLLDSILGKMSNTHEQLPVRPPNYRADEEQPGVASHYMMVRGPQDSGNGAPIDKDVCRNPDCNGREFDTDWRQGDRICRRCGCVQNNRSVESHDEEHRTFSEDKEKGKDKSRTSAVGNGGSAIAGGGTMQQIHAQTAKAQGGDPYHKRIAEYMENLRQLADRLNTNQEIRDTGIKLCEKLVARQSEHETLCKHSDCRLRKFKNPNDSYLVAGALIRRAYLDNDSGRLFEEVKGAMEKEGVDKGRMKNLGKCDMVVSDLLKGRPYNCEAVQDDDLAPAAAASGKETGGDAVPSNRSMSPVQPATADSGGPVHQSIALIPRLRQDLGMPFFLQTRATEVVEDWQKMGMPASIPQTIAAVALLRAHDEVVPADKRVEIPLDAAKVAQVVGVA